MRFYTPATPPWGRRPTNVARYPQAGRRLDKRRLAGRVDVRARISDPQSFRGWFSQRPWLYAPHHPFRVSVSVARHVTGQVFHDGEVFRSEQLIEQVAGQHYAPGTEQNLPAGGCMRRHEDAPLPGRLLVPALPRAVLEHDSAPERALPDQHPRLGRGRQRDRRQHGRDDQELSL